MPLERNSCFTGRETVLAEIRQGLKREGRAGISQVQAIAGLGGVGKNQTALEYAYRYFYEVDAAAAYHSVLWLQADSESALQRDFQALARQLNLPAADLTEPAAIVRAVHGWLQDHERWLLVLDNADDPGFVGHYLPKGTPGHVLITSRVTNLQNLGVITPLRLDTLDPPEAQDFLLKRTGQAAATAEDIAAANALAQELGYLPLALEQAAAYIVTTQAPFAAYLASYRQRRLDLLSDSAPMMGGDREPVATTWNLNFAAVERESPAAADLLRASAFLYPDSIPYDLIVSGAELLGEAIQGALANAEADPLAFLALLAPLRQYSLVRSETDQTYRVHRLVQAVVRANLPEPDERLWAKRVVEMVTQAYPNADDFNHWPECERLLLHAQNTAAVIQELSLESETVALLQTRLGFYLKAQAHYEAAEPLYQEALAMRKVLLGDAHPDVATSLNNLAALYRSQGRYEAAEPLYQEALAMRQALLGEAHPHIANSLNNLALMYTSQGRYETAEPLYQESLAMRKALLGETHPHVANSLNNLALMYTSQGRYEAAEPLYQEALAMRKVLLSEAHPDVAQSLNNLAVLYRSQGRYAEAEPLAIQSLQMSTNLLDSNHPDVAICLGNLATLRVAQGDFDEVEAMFLQAHQIFVNAVGSKHPYTCKTIKRLAQFVSILIESGQTDRLTDHPLTQSLLQQLQQS